MRGISYIVTDTTKDFSLSIHDSDYSQNTIVMEQVVGTLLKFNHQDQAIPFLAESWKVVDGLKWIFKLRPNLKCENGEEITAESYVNNFKNIFRMLAKSNELPTFDCLRGWDAFITGKSSDLGLFVEDKVTIVFSFSKKVEGVEEYLSMPYFGYYASANFNIDGNWANKGNVIASGAYRVASFSQDEIKLLAREDMFQFKITAPLKVLIQKKELNQALKDNKDHTIIAKRGECDLRLLSKSNFTTAKGRPVIAYSLILNPKGSRFFSTIENRQIFIKHFLNEKSLLPLLNSDSELSNDLFLDHPSATSFFEGESNQDQFSISNEGPLIIYSPYPTENKECSYIKELICRVCHKLNIQYEFTNAPSDSSKDVIKKLTKECDLRISGVHAGTKIDYFIVKMIFCSDLGVSYPDPYNKLGSLTKLYEEGKIDLADFQQQFNRIYREDSAVLPVLHSGPIWFVSKEINLNNDNGRIYTPRFDLIEVK
ncbi:MAG: hypothetical protein HQK50_07000 [Oligoflexia bacterium]|nr:hypothetical protein [Oligoflexia bacterium]